MPSGLWVAIWLLTLLGAFPRAQEVPLDELRKDLVIEIREDENGKISFGSLTVYENRQTRQGRRLVLDMVILHATGQNPRPDPVFVLAGGPGMAVTTQWREQARNPIRRDRDIVLVDQRGTGGSHRLDLPLNPDPMDLQQYFEPIFEERIVRAGLEALRQKADLRQYSTPIAMDDLNDVRRALGYDSINLSGSSYGTRAALVYIRRHGKSVRTATLNGVAPIPFTNPLYHAREAQSALESLFEEVESSVVYRRSFPELRRKFHEILARLDEEPAAVEVQIVGTGQTRTVRLSREAFARALRLQLYYLGTNRQVPLQLLRAHQGDYKPLVLSSILRNRDLLRSVALGMLLCVTSSEDVARIDPDDVARLTEGTFLGDGRVRRQMSAARFWPRSELDEGFGSPVRSDVPTLLLSGTLDPVTPPSWGDFVQKNFSRSLHLVVPGAHGVGGACIQSVQEAFLELGSVEGLDTSCAEKIRLPPLVLPVRRH